MKKSILTLLMALVLVVSIAAPAGAGGFMDKMRTLKNKIVSAVSSEEKKGEEEQYVIEKLVKKLLTSVKDKCDEMGIEPEEAIEQVMGMITNEEGKVDITKALSLIRRITSGETGTETGTEEEEIPTGGYIEMLRNREPVLQEYILNEYKDTLEPGDVQLVSYVTSRNEDDDLRFALGYFCLMNFNLDGKDLKFKNSAGNVEYLIFDMDDDLKFTLTEATPAAEGEEYSASIDAMCEKHKVTRAQFDYDTSELQREWEESSTLMYFLGKHPEYERIEYNGEMKNLEEMEEIYDNIFGAVMEESFAASME